MIFKRPKAQTTQPDPFAMMQMAVEVVNSSPHPTNKIAAAVSQAKGSQPLSPFVTLQAR